MLKENLKKDIIKTINIEKGKNMNCLYEETRYIMKQNNINANKSLGQNFLINEDVVDAIISASKVCKEDVVIEIGPGLGTLTKPLLERAGKVVCVELDKRMLSILKQRFIAYKNLEIINEDILKLDLKSKINEELEKYQKVKVVANLPYYITTPIIMKLLEEKLNIESITVMVQKEVANRLTATPGEADTGAITYTINYYTRPEKVIEVPKDSFIPVPEVDSTVIKLEILKEPSIKTKNEKMLFTLIKQAFTQRRKTLTNALNNVNGMNKQQIETMLNILGIDPKIRGEKLTLQEFHQIAEYIDKQK